MTADQFLSLLEERQLLSERHLTSLRRQVEDSKKKVEAISVAKLLVKKKILTKYQAKNLLETKVDDDVGAAAAVDDNATPTTSEGETGHHVQDLNDLGLSPLEEEVLDAPPPLVETPHTDAPDAAGFSETEPEVEIVEPDDGPEVPLNMDVLEPLGDEDMEPADAAFLQEDLSSDSSDDLADGAIVGELLDDEDFEEDVVPAGEPGLGPEPGAKFTRSIKLKTTSKKNEWDSPLILIGGPALVLLILVGGLAWYLFRADTGQRMFDLAQEQYAGGSYTSAMKNYDDFLRDYPDHTSASLARVHRGLAALRLEKSGSDSSKAWEKAQEVIDDIHNEKDFPQVQAELATLLPEIAEALTQDAKKSDDAEEVKRKMDGARAVIGMIQQRTDVIPPNLRATGRVDEIRRELDLIEIGITSQLKLAATLKVMQEVAAAGKVGEAYAARNELLAEYPDLRANEQLVDMVRRVAEAETGTIQKIDQQLDALDEEPKSPILASVAMAMRQGETYSQAAGQVVIFQIQGAVYALDSSSGELLWRRFVGFDYKVRPVPIEAKPGADVLLVDASRNELLRVDASTGKLRWRLPLAQRCAAPAVAGGNRAVVADRSGRLVLVDLETGDSSSQAVFAQPLRVSPAIHPNGKLAYQLGEHSSIYVMSLDDMSCRQVVYLGHSPGTVDVPPTVVLGQVLVFENWGEKASTLHVFGTNEDGTALTKVQEIRLTGRVHQPPIIDGRKVVLVTDLGQLSVFEVGTADQNNPLVLVAEKQATAEEPTIRYAALSNDQLWIAHKRLAKYEIHAASGRLASHAFDDKFEGDVFDSPPQMIGDLLIVLRRRAGHEGYLVSALNPNSRKIWETEIGVPPAGDPAVRSDPLEVLVANASGAFYRLNSDAIKRSVADQPLVTRTSDQPVLTAEVDFGDGGTTVLAAEGSNKILVYNPAAGASPLQWRALPDKLTCPPAAWQNGLLAPTSIGQVFWIDPSTGGPFGTPFQPTLSPGEPLSWHSPAVVGDNQDAFVISDGQTKLYRVGQKSDPPQLVKLAESEDLSAPLVSAAACVGQVVYVADKANFLQCFSLPELQSLARVALRSPIAWGPYPAGQHVFVATESDQLFCLDEKGQLVWQVELADAPLVGQPIRLDEDVLAATQAGALIRLNLATGHETSRLELGQSLSTGPVPFRKNLLVVGHDGTLLFAKVPGQP